MPRPKAELILSDDERQTLKTWASRPKSTQRLAHPGEDRPGLRRRTRQQDRRDEARRLLRHRRHLAASLHRASVGGPGPTSPAPVPHASSPTPTSSESSRRPWSPSPRRRPTGALAAWPANSGCRSRPSAGSGVPSGSSRTRRGPSSCRPTRSSSRRSATSSGCMSARRSGRSSCASTRRARSRHWTGPSRCCP